MAWWPGNLVGYLKVRGVYTVAPRETSTAARRSRKSSIPMASSSTRCPWPTRGAPATGMPHSGRPSVEPSFIGEMGDSHRLHREWRTVGHGGLWLSLRQSGSASTMIAGWSIATTWPDCWAVIRHPRDDGTTARGWRTRRYQESRPTDSSRPRARVPTHTLRKYSGTPDRAL